MFFGKFGMPCFLCYLRFEIHPVALLPMQCCIFLCKACSKQCIVCTESFRSRFNNYKPMGVSLKGIPSNKRHLKLTFRMTNIVVWVTGKLPSLVKQIVRGEESLFEWMNSPPSSQMDLMSVMLCSFYVLICLTFRQS